VSCCSGIASLTPDLCDCPASFEFNQLLALLTMIPGGNLETPLGLQKIYFNINQLKNIQRMARTLHI
jgi:hypothetical protein